MNFKKSWWWVVSCLWCVHVHGQEANPHDFNTQNYNTFTSKSLNEQELDAFEKRAKQKLEDFYNYLEVVSNPSYNDKLRQDAKKQALELFSGNTCMVNGVTIGVLLDSCLSLKIRTNTNPTSPEKISVKKKFPPVPDVVGYAGTLAYVIGTEKHEAGMMLIKTEKLFGKEKKQVWTVYLCEIR